MPVLEGMASGLAVVATNCLGVLTFAQHGVNALLGETQVKVMPGPAEVFLLKQRKSMLALWSKFTCVNCFGLEFQSWRVVPRSSNAVCHSLFASGSDAVLLHAGCCPAGEAAADRPR